MKSTSNVKRLAIKADTLRQLYIFSGNQCAFPGCKNPMITEDGAYLGEVCHIGAAKPGGQRFDEGQSDEGRRHYNNLILMCRIHHVVTNDTEKYPPARMREMKVAHERGFRKGLATMLDSPSEVHIDHSTVSLGGAGGQAPGAGGGGGGAIGKGAVGGRGGDGGRTFWQEPDGPRIESSDPRFPVEAKQFIESIRSSLGDAPGAGGGGQGAVGDGARGGDGGHGGDSEAGSLHLEAGTYKVVVGKGGRQATLPGQHSFPGGDTQLIDEQGRVVSHVSGGRRARHASSYLPAGVREVNRADVEAGLTMPLLVPAMRAEFEDGFLNLQNAGWDYCTFPLPKEAVWSVAAIVQGVRTEDIGLFLGLINPVGVEMACQAVVIHPTHRTWIVWRPIGAEFDMPGLWKLVAYSGNYVLAEYALEVRTPEETIN